MNRGISLGSIILNAVPNYTCGFGWWIPVIFTLLFILNVALDVDKDQLLEWLYEDYIQAIDSENNVERNCAIASSAIILNILWLDNYFPKDLEDFWKQKYRPILLLYVDKLKQNLFLNTYWINIFK